MGVKIIFSDFWTYNTKIIPKDRKESDKKLPITFLNDNEFTHIHGCLQIVIGEKQVPYMGIGNNNDVCFGYWIEMLADMFRQFNHGINSWVILGEEQGKPAYQFELSDEYIYLSIIDSPLGGKKDDNWQKVQFKLTEFKKEFKKFKKKLLEEIAINVPNELEKWNEKFRI